MLEDRARRSVFPFIQLMEGGGTFDYMGLQKRELFAAMAMQGLAPAYAQGGDFMEQHVAKGAVRVADALLAELAKVTP